MPNFDTGHYFLSALVPIKNGTVPNGDGSRESHLDRVRALLTLLPTALQSPATEKIIINAPFSRSLKTHFVRMWVLDDVIFNGRDNANAIVGQIQGQDLMKPPNVDKLNCAYLVISVDFDAVMNDGDPLPKKLSKADQDKVRDNFVRNVWDGMNAELLELFSNCLGFEDVMNADDFAKYIAKCQVETTMPFNDYWLHTPKLPSLSLARLGLPLLLPVALFVWSLISFVWSWISAPDTNPFLSDIVLLDHLIPIPIPNWLGMLGGILLLIPLVWLAYRSIMVNGQKPMPPGKYANLPGVLKSLYLQQTFSEFVIENQHNDAEKLYSDFGKFLAKHKPSDLFEPTQPPGYISTAAADKYAGLS